MDKKVKSSKAASKSAALEEQIVAQQKKKEEVQLLEELGKRISMAREGRVFFEKENYSESLKMYRRFLSLTARALKVEVNDLDPRLFDEKTRVQESLLISSSLLDLTKILDKLNNESANKERAECFRLYVKFTLNQPFQSHSAMNLRKYIEYTAGIRNKRQFWSVYNTIKIKKFCVIATVVYRNENAKQLEALRYFRDTGLGASKIGRCLISVYYERGPLLIGPLERWPALRSMVRGVLDTFCCLLIRKIS